MYSKRPVFCIALLRTNNNPIVITAGLENPETASVGVKYPNPKKQERMIKAVTSILKYSFIKRKNPTISTPITIIISIFIYDYFI
jgi:hypothetical protein